MRFSQLLTSLLHGHFRACGVMGMFVVFTGVLSSCSSTKKDNRHEMVVSVEHQTMAVLDRGKLVATYPISTSKYGLGDEKNSYRTPTGKLMVAKKIGHKAPAGAVFKSRQLTGEVLQPDAPGRDPIVTRILWLKGLENENRNAFARYIYIHGTPEERTIGSQTSYGCIRMKSHDVIELFDRVGEGATLDVRKDGFPMAVRSQQVRQSISRALAFGGDKVPEPETPEELQADEEQRIADARRRIVVPKES